MANQALIDALNIARTARESATDDTVKQALDDTIVDLETKIEENNA